MNNKFAGKCNVCQTWIEAGAGDCRKTDSGWKVFCRVTCQPKPVNEAPIAQAAVGNLDGIMKLFATARTHLKFPCVEIGVPAVKGLSVRINIAGDKAREPRSLTVVKSERDAVTGKRPYVGNVSMKGEWRAWKGDGFAAAEVGKRLAEFAADPVKVAGDHARLHGKCCFCRMPLKDERSTAVGYGETCAENYGLPWGDKPEEFAGSAVPKVTLAPKEVTLAPKKVSLVDLARQFEGVS